MHVWLSDVLDNDRDVKVPCAYRFIIRSRDESSVLVDEGDSIDGAEMLIVFLGNVTRIHIILDASQIECQLKRVTLRETNLDDLLI